MIPPGVRNAAKALEAAAEALRRATADAYPLGTIVVATYGRAHVRGEVIGYDDSGSLLCASEVRIRHSSTGKESTFDAQHYGVAIECPGGER